MPDHLSAADVAAYLDRSLSAPARERVEYHLAECDECREEIAAVARIVRQPSRRRQWMLGASGLAAAAAVLLLIWPVHRDARTPSSVLRDGSEGVPTVDVVTASVHGGASGSTVTLTWRSVDTDARYQVTVTDERGTLLWSTSTSDTAVTAKFPAPAARVSFWFVDALLPDGRSATSGVRELGRAP